MNDEPKYIPKLRSSYGLAVVLKVQYEQGFVIPYHHNEIGEFVPYWNEVCPIIRERMVDKQLDIFIEYFKANDQWNDAQEKD